MTLKDCKISIPLLTLRSRRVNRKTLDKLGQWFSRAGDPLEILGDLGIGQKELASLNKLAFMSDGWYPVSFLTGNRLEISIFYLLAKNGLILVKPFRGLMKLSDAGRFLLVLCAQLVPQDGHDI